MLSKAINKTDTQNYEYFLLTLQVVKLIFRNHTKELLYAKKEFQ